MSKIVNGASLQPLSGGSPKQIVLLLHGYGSNGADLISLAPHWQRDLPDALFLAPNAPQRLGSISAAYQWWPLTAFTPAALASGAASAAPAMDAFIDRKLAQYGLADASLAIVGFSQGTMMALHVAPRREDAVAGVVSISGRLLEPEALMDDTVCRPPVLLIHGDQDPVVPVQDLPKAAQALQDAGWTEVYAHIMKGTGHGIAPDGLQVALAFIRDRLGLD